MNESWIKLFRKFREWGWYRDSHTKDLFLELLLTANFEDKEWNGILIKRGQTVVGRKQLAETLGFTEQNIRTSITKLKSTNEITSKIYSKFSVITINNFEKYQQLTSTATSYQPATNQQLTTPKEYKKERNKEDINIDKKSFKKEKTYTEENLTINQIAERLVKHFEEENHRKSKLAPNSFKNLAYWLEVYQPNEIANAITQIKYDSFWKDKMDLTILFRQSGKSGEPVNWIDSLLNSKKENYARRT